MSAPAGSQVQAPKGPRGRMSRHTWWPGLVLALLIAAYVAYFGALTVQKHNAFQSTAFDLGNVDQAVWNTRHGRPFAMTNIYGLENRLGTHVEPILLPVSLVYFVWSDPRALLLLQTLAIGLGAWPLYLLARRRWTREPVGTVAALAFALIYLLFPALQSANYFDFHAVALAPTFFLFALYFLETERWGAFGLFALLTMSCKEDAPLLVLMLGLYALVVRRRPWVGLATMAASLAWFGLAVGWIMPHFDTRGVSPLANRYAYLGDGPLEMAQTMVTRPGLVLERLATGENLAYLRDLLLPTAFLALLAPQVLMLALPSLAVNLLSTDGFMHQLEGFHYGAPLAPIVVAAAAYGVGWLSRRAGRLRHGGVLLPALTLLVLAASLAYHAGHGYTPLAAGYRHLWPAVTGHHRLGARMAGEIPGEAAVAALPRLNPHASQRQRLLVIDAIDDEGLLSPLQDAGGTWSADLAWLDVTDGWARTIFKRQYGFVDIRLLPELGGGALYDVGCYPIALARYMTGAEPLSVTAQASWTESGVDDLLVGTLAFPGGVLAHFNCSLRLPLRRYYELVGAEGSLLVNLAYNPKEDAPGEIIKRGDDRRPLETYTTERLNSYTLMTEDFNRAVLDGTEVPFPAEDAVLNMRVIDAAYQAARSGGTVAL